MRNRKLFALLVSVAGLLCSCSSGYVPMLSNTPLFTKKGEFQATAQIGNGFDAQCAASVTNHLAVMANYSYGTRGVQDVRDGLSNFHKHQIIEGAFGRYWNSGGWAYEVFGGYGHGDARGRSDFLQKEGAAGFSGTYNQYSLQAGFGRNTRNFSLRVCSKFSLVEFLSMPPQINMRQNVGTVFFMQPSLAMRVYLGGSNLYYTMQTGISLPISRHEYIDRGQYRVLTTGFGLGYHFRRPEHE